MAEALLAFVVLVLPLALGAALEHLRRPWWWAAVAAVVLVVLAAVVPEPEAGEARLQEGDLVFLLIIALIAVALARLGALLARRLGAGRTR